MLLLRLFLLLPLFSAATLFSSAQNAAQTPMQLASPNGEIVFALIPGTPAQPALRYSVDFRGKRLLDESELGLDLQGTPALGPAMFKVGATLGSVDKTYTVPVGKTKNVRDHYNSLVADFQNEAGTRFSVEVRAFDDAVAFRYLVPEQTDINKARITGERTQFRYSKDATVYPLVVNGFQSSYEDDYIVKPVSGLHHDWLIALPLLAEVPGTGWLAITEADIEDYAGMYLRSSEKPLFTVKAELSPRVDQTGVAVVTDSLVQNALAGADDRGHPRAPDRVEHHPQPEPPPRKLTTLHGLNRENPPGTGGRATTLPA